MVSRWTCSGFCYSDRGDRLLALLYCGVLTSLKPTANMSVYLPDINGYIYPKFSEELDVGIPPPKIKPRKPKLVPLPVHDEAHESNVVPLPDIRITNGHAQPPDLSEVANDLLSETLDESAMREAQRRRVAFKEEESDHSSVSPRESGQHRLSRRRTIRRSNSLSRLFRDINNKSRQPHVVPPKRFLTREQVSAWRYS